MMAATGPNADSSRINLAETADFEVGGLRVSPAHREASMNGDRRDLAPRVAQVLVALSAARPEVVSRDRLIEQCWDGRIVGDDALNRCIVALRHLAKDFTPQPFAIETVARVGYALVERPEVAAARRNGSVRRKAAFATLLAVLLLAAGFAFNGFRVGRAEAAPASIAVLPFRNLSAGDPYFAQGVGEEIMGQLSREPQFRIAGGTSSNQFGAAPDVGEVARKLNVDYVLEGSVRTEGERVRINAGLIRASDRVRLWSDVYDGTLDDVLAIQQRIGVAIAGALKRRLVPAPSTARAVNGEAYALYLNARGLVRSGTPQAGQDAIPLLEESIRLDPKFAPAWAGLASALELEGTTKGNEGLIAALPRAQQAARRALQLDPDSADAHGVLADLIGSDTPEAQAHLRRAAELDPRSGQGQIWRGMVHFVAGEYAPGLVAYRSAQDLDPLWTTPGRILVNVYSWMGDRRAAEAALPHAFPNDPMGQHHGLARLAWMRGDFSEAARHWSIVASQPASPWASPAKLSLEDIKYLLRLSDTPPSRPVRPMVGQFREGPRVWMDAAPSPSEWRHRNRSSAAALVNHDLNIVAAKRMLAAGRSRELAATYDGPSGLLYMRPGVPVGVCDLHEAPLVALALRGAGRNAEAEALLRQADAVIRTVYARGRVPVWLDEDAAAIWAVQGKRGPAITALDRALTRGGAHVGRTDLVRLEDEPALRSLHGDPRFTAFLAKYAAHFARERQETARALKLAVSSTG